MNCPRCQSALYHGENQSIHLDVCQKGCGGIWFDHRELKKLDESHEADPKFLEFLDQGSRGTIDLGKLVKCPVCPDQPMKRYFWSVKRQVEVDECPKCGGMWLDAGELTHIHSLFKTEADRKQAAAQMFDEMFGPNLEKLKEEGRIKAEAAGRLRNAIRFILPSNYLPNKF